MGKLTVYLDRIENLNSEDYKGKADPYVKFEVEKDNLIFDKDYGDRKSTKKKGELNPIYGETFTFRIPDLDKKVLKIKVYDDDFITSDDKLGECKLKLDKIGIPADGQPMEIEQSIENNWFSKDGKIFLRISYTEGGGFFCCC